MRHDTAGSLYWGAWQLQAGGMRSSLNARTRVLVSGAALTYSDWLPKQPTLETSRLDADSPSISSRFIKYFNSPFQSEKSIGVVTTANARCVHTAV